MSTGTPSAHNRTRMTPTTRTARPLIPSVRPVRIDLGGDSPFGGHERHEALYPEQGILDETPQLADMLDRAAAQVLTLRKAVDDAVVADRMVRAQAGELARRMAQGERFAADFDERIARAGRAAGVVEKAATALGALEAVVANVRNVQEAVEKNFEGKLAAQELVLRQRLAEQEAAFESRMASQQELFERRLGELSGHFESALARASESSNEAREEADRVLGEHRRAIKGQAEEVCATADRHVAQAQARASLILDGVSDRLDVLGQQCDRIGTQTQSHIDALCQRAAAILGHDPRSDFQSEPKLGSLADAAARADALIMGVDDAAIRIGAVRSDAEGVLTRLVEARAASESGTQAVGAQLEALRETVERSMAKAAQMHELLEGALHQQADAADKSAQASMLLSRQREDLLAIAEAGRYHVEQCRAAEESLRTMVETAGERSGRLEVAVGEVRTQAETMVALAREAATLIAHARAVTPARGADAQG